MAKITGIGGVFFKSRDPAALTKWYVETLGFPGQTWGGAKFDNQGIAHATVWSPFKEATDYFAPSTASFMFNYAVDDLEGFIAMLESKGVEILKRESMDGVGHFAHIMDPEGNKIELWQPV